MPTSQWVSLQRYVWLNWWDTHIQYTQEVKVIKGLSLNRLRITPQSASDSDCVCLFKCVFDMLQGVQCLINNHVDRAPPFATVRPRKISHPVETLIVCTCVCVSFSIPLINPLTLSLPLSLFAASSDSPQISHSHKHLCLEQQCILIIDRNRLKGSVDESQGAVYKSVHHVCVILNGINGIKWISSNQGHVHNIKANRWTDELFSENTTLSSNAVLWLHTEREGHTVSLGPFQ